MNRRTLLLTASLSPLLAAPALAQASLTPILDDAARLENLRAIAVWSNGSEIAARGYGRFTPDSPTNIKSASKSIVSALAGIAITSMFFARIGARLAHRLPRLPREDLHLGAEAQHARLVTERVHAALRPRRVHPLLVLVEREAKLGRHGVERRDAAARVGRPCDIGVPNVAKEREQRAQLCVRRCRKDARVLPRGVFQSTVTMSRCTLSPTATCALAIE